MHLQAKAGCPGGCTGPRVNEDAHAPGPPAAASMETSVSLGNPQGLAARPHCVPTLWLCSLSLSFHLPALSAAWLSSSYPPYCSTRMLSLHPSPCLCPATSMLQILDFGLWFGLYLSLGLFVGPLIVEVGVSLILLLGFHCLSFYWIAQSSLHMRGDA